MRIRDKERRICLDCVCWTRISDVDGGIGICDSIISDHNQHVIGYVHQACDMGIIGVSVENQGTADERIPLLLQIPAATRFVSCEPLEEEAEAKYKEKGENDGGRDTS